MRDLAKTLRELKANYNKTNNKENGNTPEVNENTPETAEAKIRTKELLNWAVEKGFKYEYNPKYNEFCSRHALHKTRNDPL